MSTTTQDFEEAARYERELTPRQKEVLGLIARGETNWTIGQHLGISLDGAKWHVSEILGKLAFSSREQAADYWRWRNSFPVRARFALRGLFALPAAKIIAGATATGLVVGAGIAIAVLVVRTTDPSAPDAPPIEDCAFDRDACNFAAELRQWVANRDLDALASRTTPFDYTCPAGQGLGRPDPLCAGAPPGEVRRGNAVAAAQSDDFRVVADLRPELERLVPAGGTVVGLLCPEPEPEAKPCADEFMAMVSPPGGGDGRVLAVQVRRTAEGMRIGALLANLLLEGPVTEEFDQEYLDLSPTALGTLEARYYPVPSP